MVDGDVGEISKNKHVETRDQNRKNFVSDVELRMVERGSDEADER